jgi:hypothetical protein
MEDTMKRTFTHKQKFWIRFTLLLAVTVTGCSTQVADKTTTDDPGYTGTLDTSYENALDPISQLALGTLNIEGTADAVTVPSPRLLDGPTGIHCWRCTSTGPACESQLPWISTTGSWSETVRLCSTNGSLSCRET